jgi:hypothetical protein
MCWRAGRQAADAEGQRDALRACCQGACMLRHGQQEHKEEAIEVHAGVQKPSAWCALLFSGSCMQLDRRCLGGTSCWRHSVQVVQTNEGCCEIHCAQVVTCQCVVDHMSIDPAGCQLVCSSAPVVSLF